ncbi:MAG: hypothetical protein IJ542_00680 [Clostridia bacterium]|nr:hypothetical protein [Clostridia bacterium]
MDIGKIMIIVAAVGFVILFATIIFVSGKSKKNKKKVEATKKQEAPKVQPNEPEKKEDNSFKVSRANKNSRVSRKALKNNSRTATIEKVYQREPETAEANSDVEIQLPTEYDEDFTQAVSQVRSEGRKVVAIGDLIKAEEVKPISHEDNLEEEDLPNRAPLDVDLRERFPIDSLPNLEEIRRRVESRNRQQTMLKPDDKQGINMEEVVKTDAIMNPKFKNKK